MPPTKDCFPKKRLAEASHGRWKKSGRAGKRRKHIKLTDKGRKHPLATQPREGAPGTVKLCENRSPYETVDHCTVTRL